MQELSWFLFQNSFLHLLFQAIRRVEEYCLSTGSTSPQPVVFRIKNRVEKLGQRLLYYGLKFIFVSWMI